MKSDENDRKNIKNSIDFAKLEYISDLEFQEILDDVDLVKSLKKGLKEVKNGEYEFV